MTEPAAATEELEQRPQLEPDVEMVDDLAELIQSGQRGMVLNLVADLFPADLAQLLLHLEFEEASRLFQWLPDEKAAGVLPELEDSYRSSLLQDQPRSRITRLLDRLDSDDATDVLADLPDELALRILPGLEQAADVGELLSYGEETAGGIMETELVAVSETAALGAITEEVRRSAEAVEPVYVVYITDDGGRLRGVLSLKQLLLYPSDLEIGEIMETDVLSVHPEMDQEEVARIMEKYDLVSLPVVDEDGYLLGRVMIDDVVDVIREEAEEDIQRMSGISGDEEYTASVMSVSRGRLPWLVLAMAGAYCSGLVIDLFSGSLADAVVLAVFIPIVTAMGGNAAIQSAAISVQALASGELWAREVMKRLGKELLVSLINGVVLAVLLGGVTLLTIAPDEGQAVRLALTVGTTLFTVVMLATSNGAVMPIMLERIGADPADAMGPFVTTLNDIVGLTVYFLIAAVLYL